MDPKRQQLIDVARTWIGVPFLHQGRSRAGVDCIGFLYGIATDMGWSYENYVSYGRQPNPRAMGLGLRSQLIQLPSKDDALPGDVFWIAWGTMPMHVALFTGTTIIHSLILVKKVVEQTYDDTWRAQTRIAFRFKELA